jgi:large subunit ribosomal protein L5
MRLRQLYQKKIIPELKKKFDYKNALETPRLEKVTVNVGLGRNLKDNEFIDEVLDNLTKITGQKPVLTKAKKSVSSFKVREGMVIGAKVTLRGQRMYDFVEKLVNITFPRVRDFRGISESVVDAQGNLSIGFRENTPFAELDIQNIKNLHGLEVCITTTTNNKEEGLELFRLLGFPFKESMADYRA